jgi:Ser/Thr protein kinase RdoA (MazF antagonist)
MQPFEQLTARGKLRRLARLARAALGDHDLRVRKQRLLAIQTNILFRVDADAGRRYVLRLGAQHHRTLAQTRIEAAWMFALSRETDVRLAAPVPRSNGELAAMVQIPEVPLAFTCALFQWVPGHGLVHDPRPMHYRALGRAMAIMHRHAETFIFDLGVDLWSWQSVTDSSDTAPILWSDAAYAVLSASELEVVRQATHLADQALASLYRSGMPASLVHGDLHGANVHVHRNELYIMDFDDFFLGYPAQDIAISLFHCPRGADRQALREAFQEGYESVRGWPLMSEEQLETLIMARRLGLMNRAAGTLADPRPFLQDGVATLRRQVAMLAGL